MLVSPTRLMLGQAGLVRPVFNFDFLSGALDSRATFTRASAAWYYNSSGVLTSAATDTARFDYDPSTARTNLILRSSEQDNSGAWTASQVTVTANTVANPVDAAVTADTFTENSGSTSRGTAQAVTIATNVSQSFSVYAKAGTRSWLRLMLNTGSDSVLAWFNLGTGVVGSTSTEGTGSSPTSSITAVGTAGWYRCTLTGIPSSSNSGSIGAYIRMATADSEFSYQGNGVGTLHVWGAQLETGAATAYIATTSAAVTVCTARGLLLEEARTNLFLNSAAVGSWTSMGDAVVTSNTAVAPDGTTTADLITMMSNGSVPGNTLTLAASTTYSISIFIKDGATSPFLRVRISTAASSLSGYFNLSTGALGAFGTGMSGGRVDTLAAGWKRYSFQYLPAGGDEGSRSIVFAGVTANSSGTASGAFTAWGAQVEAGSFVTSHIPTTVASVTRAIDVCSVATSAFAFNAVEGTLFAAFTPMGVTGLQTAIYLDDGTNNERMGARASSAALAGVVVDGGVSQASVSGGTMTAVATKVAFAYKLDNIGLAVNGVAGTTDTSATLPTVTNLLIGTRLTGSESLSGWYTRAAYYNRRLPNGTLARIST